MLNSLIMLRGYVIKLYPNKAQEELLNKHFGCCRWVYNEMIRINQKKYHRTGRGLSGYDMQSYLPKLKKQYSWLSEVNSQSLQIVCHNLADAYNRFFKKQTKYPVFKKKGNDASFTCINYSWIEENHIRLPKLGKIRYRGGNCPNGNIRRFIIRKKANSFYASVLIDVPKNEVPLRDPENILGIDLGLTDIVVTSTGEIFPASKLMKKSKSKLRIAHKHLSQCQKGSNRRNKAKLALAKIHKKVSNQRKDFNHKLSRILVSKDENQAFAIEDLNIKGMMSNHKLAVHIADCGWGQFLTFLKYKAPAVGKQVLEVDRFYPSSKTCSVCGLVRGSLSLSIREWTCNECSTVHHRDVNAAINIAYEAARNSVSDRGDGVIPNVLRSVPVCETRSSI